MPVTNQGTPTVQVSVPVPTPVQQQPQGQPKPKKAPRPTRIPQEDPMTGGGSGPAQPQPAQAQLPPPVPVPRAIILPWAPPGGQQRMRRRYAAEKYDPIQHSKWALSASREAPHVAFAGGPGITRPHRLSPHGHYAGARRVKFSSLILANRALHAANAGNSKAAESYHTNAAIAHRGNAAMARASGDETNFNKHIAAAEAHDRAAVAHRTGKPQRMRRLPKRVIKFQR